MRADGAPYLSFLQFELNVSLWKGEANASQKCETGLPNDDTSSWISALSSTNLLRPARIVARSTIVRR